MTRPALVLSLQFADASHRALLPRQRVLRIIRAALDAPAQLTVRIVGLDEGRALNREFRAKDGPTLRAHLRLRDRAGGGGGPDPARAGWSSARRASRASRSPPHYAHLLVHGALHAQGHEWDARGVESCFEDSSMANKEVCNGCCVSISYFKQPLST